MVVFVFSILRFHFFYFIFIGMSCAYAYAYAKYMHAIKMGDATIARNTIIFPVIKYLKTNAYNYFYSSRVPRIKKRIARTSIRPSVHCLCSWYWDEHMDIQMLCAVSSARMLRLLNQRYCNIATLLISYVKDASKRLLPLIFSEILSKCNANRIEITKFLCSRNLIWFVDFNVHI